MARANILDILYRNNSIFNNSFDYDQLSGISISSLLTNQDVYDLYCIAEDKKLNGDIRKKTDLFNRVLNPRGFKKLIAGTNRICYKFMEDRSIVIKVAKEAVGMKDNPAEYRNQHYLKPFVCKCFECTRCGTLATFERVDPITTFEQFMEINNDIFDLLMSCIDGRFILEDIGSDYYLNYGLRKGFGPVLLDYPYLYELDGNKLRCNRPDPNTPIGVCDGEIDYDSGFNNLVCEKCGKRYFAIDLKKDIENKNIIIRGKGDIKMRIRLIRGNETVNEIKSNIEKVAETVPNVSKSVDMADISKYINSDFDDPRDEETSNIKEEKTVTEDIPDENINEEDFSTEETSDIVDNGEDGEGMMEEIDIDTLPESLQTKVKFVCGDKDKDDLINEY